MNSREQTKKLSRRTVLRRGTALAALGVIGVSSASAAPGNLVNAEVKSSGAIVATGDDFVISGQNIAVDGEAFYESDGESFVIFNDGYSGEIRHNTMTVESVQDRTFGIRVDGGDVTVSNNSIEAGDDINNRFIAVHYLGGATGKVTNNDITGAHRVGVLATESGTDVEIARNDIEGPGPREQGWADNGVQLSGGTTGMVRGNTIAGHWYSPNSFVSTGVLAYGDEITLLRNDFTDNDLSILLAGDDSSVVKNTTSVEFTQTDTAHYGVYDLGGENNAIVNNTIETAAAANGVIGIIVLGTNTKLIRNSLSGWEDLILDAGDETKLPDPFNPDL